MARRGSLLLTAFLFLILGVAAGYLFLSIPRDVRAEALLKQARQALQEKKSDEARQTFERVVKEYPRTDAAGAATYALFRILDQERQELERKLTALEKQRQTDAKKIADVERVTTELAKRPVPAPA